MVHRIPSTVRIAEDELHDLVLFAADDGVTAVGAGGVLWEQPGPWVDLKFERIASDAITCSVLTSDAVRPEIRLDPATGALL